VNDAPDVKISVDGFEHGVSVVGAERNARGLCEGTKVDFHHPDMMMLEFVYMPFP
jgi:hypothetical protein